MPRNPTVFVAAHTNPSLGHRDLVIGTFRTMSSAVKRCAEHATDNGLRFDGDWQQIGSDAHIAVTGGSFYWVAAHTLRD